MTKKQLKINQRIVDRNGIMFGTIISFDLIRNECIVKWDNHHSSTLQSAGHILQCYYVYIPDDLS